MFAARLQKPPGCQFEIAIEKGLSQREPGKRKDFWQIAFQVWLRMKPCYSASSRGFKGRQSWVSIRCNTRFLVHMSHRPEEKNRRSSSSNSRIAMIRRAPGITTPITRIKIVRMVPPSCLQPNFPNRMELGYRSVWNSNRRRRAIPSVPFYGWEQSCYALLFYYSYSSNKKGSHQAARLINVRMFTDF